MNRIQTYERAELRHALKKAEPAIFEDVMQFLMDDCREFYSGYLKAMIWKYITRYPLTFEHIEHLQAVALKYLERPMCGEFMPMCRTMTRIATPKFREIVKSKLNDENPQVRLNAYCLNPYAQGLAAGTKQSIELKRLKRSLPLHDQFRWRHLTPILRINQVLEMIRETDHWKKYRPLHQLVDGDELPIVLSRAYHATDTIFASFDWSKCLPDVLFPKLEQALFTGKAELITSTAWLYVLYVLDKVKHPKTVSLLIHFMREKIEPKYFENAHTWMLTQAVYKVLTHFGTPEALEAVKRYKPRTETALAHLMKERREQWYFW